MLKTLRQAAYILVMLSLAVTATYAGDSNGMSAESGSRIFSHGCHAEQWIRILQALLTPVIGLTTSYIAWQQWQTNKQKLDWDRYERRLRVYEEVRNFIGLVIRNLKPEITDLTAYKRAVAEADFLYGKDIINYIDEVYKHGITLWQLNKEYRDHTYPDQPSYDHAKIVTGLHDEGVWFSQQPDNSRLLFGKYLNIGS